MTPRRRRALTFVAWAVLTVFIAGAVLAVDRQAALDALRRMHPGWLSVAVALNAAILAAWAGLWLLLTPRRRSVPYVRMLEVTAMSSAAMNTLPALAGHATAAGLLEHHARIGREAALSVLALDQLGEGLVKLLIFLLIGLLVPMPAWIRPGLVTASIAVGAVLVALVWMAYRHRNGDPDEQPRHDGRRERLRAFAARWARGLDALRSWRLSLAALCMIALMKAIEGLGIVAVQHSFGVEVSAATTVLVLGALTLATIVPVTPGNLGAYEASVFLAYRSMGVPAEHALPLAIVQHVAFLVPAVGIGYVVVMARGIGWSAIRAADSPVPRKPEGIPR